jgi:hypothetical protein
MSLYLITDELKRLIDAFDHFGHESSEAAEAIKEHTALLVEAFDAKADDYAALIRTAETRAAARNEESERMRKLAQDDEALASRLRLALMTAMKETGRLKVQTARFKLSVQNNGGKIPVIINDESSLPEAFRVPKVSITIDKDGIREELEKGVTVPGATLGERGQRLNLK